MLGQFNTASLAKFSEDELQAMIGNYLNLMPQARTDFERAALNSQIQIIQAALRAKPSLG